jgi:hypothetical protein
MAKARGYPDRRGMGAQSDFISETFVPSEQHQREQVHRAKVLMSRGMSLTYAAKMLSVDAEWLSRKMTNSEHSRLGGAGGSEQKG